MIDGRAGKSALAALTLAFAPTLHASGIDGHWEGEIEIPNQPLVVKVDFNRDGDQWRGTIDIPAQGATSLDLDPVKVERQADGVAVEFSIRGVPGDPTFVGLETNVELLRNDPRFDRVDLLGHSEGGLVSVLLASRRDDVDFVVLLAAPGVPGVELMKKQNERVFDAAGLPDELKTALLGLLDQLFAALVSDLPEEELRERVETIALEQMAVSGVTAVQPDDERVRVAVESALLPWMRHFLRLDPGPALAATTVPVLALNGELDVQVDAQQNLSAIASALEQGGNADVDIHRLPGLNHLFQHAETGLVDEYMAIEETISPEVLDLVRDWILGVVR